MTSQVQIISHDPQKQDFLNTLSLLDNSVLERLVKLSQTCIIPDDDQLVTVTFEQMVDKAHKLADLYFPEWTDRSKADFGEFLVELFSLFSEKDFWFINAFANEGYLVKATLYSSVYAHALRLGYTPKTLKSAEGWVNVTFAAGEYYQYQVGELRVMIDGETYSNSQIFPVPASVTTTVVQVKVAHGYYDTMQTRFNGRSVIVEQTGTDMRSVEQRISGVMWLRVDSFAQSDKSSKHFVVIPNENSSVEVVYGKNNFGMIPEFDSVIDTKYRIGGGTKGNKTFAVAPAVTVTVNNGLRLTVIAELLGSLYGGEDVEDIEWIRNNVSPNFRTLQRIINCSDCEDILNMMPEIYQSKVISFTNSFTFRVIPTSGIPASDAFLESLAETLSGKVMEGFGIGGTQSTYRTVNSISLTAVMLRGYDTVEAISKIKSIISNWTNPLKNQTYGKGFIFADVTAEIIRSVAGVQNVINWYADSNVTVTSDGIVLHDVEILSKLAENGITVTISY